MINWRAAAGSNEAITAYIVSWRLGHNGHFNEGVTVSSGAES